MQTDKVALVTGGGRGIGRAIVLGLAEKGWKVAINYHTGQAAAEQTSHMVAESGVEGILLQANIADAAERASLVDRLLQHYGRIDLLVNNAGIAPRRRRDLLETSEDSFDEVLAVNLKGPFFLSQSVAGVLIRLLQEGKITQPKIINIGSLSAYAASPDRSEYCISKAGLSMVTALLAARLAEYGINVYEVRPGIIETDMTRIVHDKYERLIADGLTPTRRWGQPQDVAQAVVAIAEGYFPFSTGAVIDVDGGFHLRRL